MHANPALIVFFSIESNSGHASCGALFVALVADFRLCFWFCFFSAMTMFQPFHEPIGPESSPQFLKDDFLELILGDAQRPSVPQMKIHAFGAQSDRRPLGRSARAPPDSDQGHAPLHPAQIRSSAPPFPVQFVQCRVGSPTHLLIESEPALSANLHRQAPKLCPSSKESLGQLSVAQLSAETTQR